MELKAIELNELTKKIDPIVAARDNWYLVTAEAEGKVNTLTAGWFTLGNNWEKKIATVFIRPQRYTKQFIDESGHFTLTFFDGYQDAMGYLGSNSGADVPDKIEKSGLHLAEADGQPTFAEGKYVLLCKVLYRQPIAEACFLDKDFAAATYPERDFSVQYVGEIEAAYEIVG